MLLLLLLLVSVSTVLASHAALGKTWTSTVGDVRALPGLTLLPSEVAIVSYNILGPLHGESSKHDYAPVSITKWTRRRERLMDELRGLQADVLCLQEVSQKSLRETFIPGLRSVGLVCSGFAPTRTGHESKGRFGHKSIGCAIFTRASKLDVLSSKRVHLRDFAPLDGCASHDFHADVVGLSQSMAMLHLRLRGQGEGEGQGQGQGQGEEGEGEGEIKVAASAQTPQSDGGEEEEEGEEEEAAGKESAEKESSDPAPPAPEHSFIVANTHLFWNPDRADIKATQTAAAARALQHFARDRGFASSPSTPPPVVLCGDFNSPPEMPFDPSLPSVPSAPFSLLTTGVLPPDHPEHPDRWFSRLRVQRHRPGGFRSFQNAQSSSSSSSAGGSDPSPSAEAEPYSCPQLGPFTAPFLLSNVYQLAPFSPFAPLLTTKTDDFSGWIDHIFLSSTVEATHVLTPPILRASLTASLENRAFAPMPNKAYPSDHLPIGAVVRVA